MTRSVDKDKRMPLAAATNEGSKLHYGARPLVSILINNYNYASFLSAAIESALNQTYGNFEVVVVDDGSTDSSREVIAKYGSSVILIAKDNGGQASAFNAGFAASSGEILCFLDADDRFLPDKVGTVVQIFQDNPQIGWCFDQVQQFDEKTGHHYAQAKDCKFGLWDYRAAIVNNGKVPYIPTATSGMSFRRSMLDSLLPMPEVIRITSDGYLKLAALGLSEGWMASEVLTLQRIHTDNAYTRRSGGNRSIMALTGLLVGMCLYERFPILRRFAVNMFSTGLGLSWIARVSSADHRRVVGPFLHNMGITTRINILSKAVYCSARTLLSDLRRTRSVAT